MTKDDYLEKLLQEVSDKLFFSMDFYLGTHEFSLVLLKYH